MKPSLLHLVIWICISVAVFIGHGFWYAGIVNKSVSVADLQNQIDTKTKTAERIISARATLAEIAGDESAVESRFVPETGVVSFIDDLETRAREQGAVMKVLSVSVGTDKKQPTLVFSLSTSGSFDAVMRTLGAVEYAPYNLSLSKLSAGKDGKSLWHADFELIVGSVPNSSSTTTQAVSSNAFSSLLNTYAHS